MSAVQDVLSQTRISEVWRGLGGPELHRGRGRRFWRGGDNQDAVSLSDAKNTFYDHVDGSGGGVLDLIALVRGGARQDALKWLADFTGTPLEDRPLAPADREQWAAARRELEADLPAARLWRRVFVNLIEATGDAEKAKLFDPVQGPADTNAMRDMFAMLATYRGMTGGVLVGAYRAHRESEPLLTAWCVARARRLEIEDRQVLLDYLRAAYPEWSKAA